MRRLLARIRCRLGWHRWIDVTHLATDGYRRRCESCRSEERGVVVSCTTMDKPRVTTNRVIWLRTGDFFLIALCLCAAGCEGQLRIESKPSADWPEPRAVRLAPLKPAKFIDGNGAEELDAVSSDLGADTAILRTVLLPGEIIATRNYRYVGHETGRPVYAERETIYDCPCCGFVELIP